MGYFFTKYDSLITIFLKRMKFQKKKNKIRTSLNGNKTRWRMWTKEMLSNFIN